MTADRPRLVVTLPARSVEAARREIASARAAGADLAEVRFDRWPARERARAADLFPSPIPLIATLRSPREGGEGPDEGPERSETLAALALLPFAYIDSEPARDPMPRARPSGPPGSSVPLQIVSTHFPAGSSVAEIVEGLVQPTFPGALRKVVAPLPTGVALNELLPALAGLPAGEPRTVHTTGGSGPILRVLGQRLGLALVYASLPAPPGSPALETVEPAQVPVDDLVRLFDTAGAPRLFGVVGHSVRHSLSPRVHGAWLAAEGRRAAYVAIDIVSAEELRASVPRLSEVGFRGLNVTHPWKAEALALSEDATATAAECGSANCLTLTGDRVAADNTDVVAATRRLTELREAGRWDGQAMTVFGAGGAARAAVVAGGRLRATVKVVARRRRAAEAVARAHGAEVGDPRRPVPASLVVQATSAGHAGSGPLELPLHGFVRPGGYVLDWVYGGADGAAAAQAHRAGAGYEGGERLLVYQAVRSYEIWWGTPPAEPDVRTALREVGCAD